MGDSLQGAGAVLTTLLLYRIGGNCLLVATAGEINTGIPVAVLRLIQKIDATVNLRKSSGATKHAYY
jgi:hypothetical protein